MHTQLPNTKIGGNYTVCSEKIHTEDWNDIPLIEYIIEQSTKLCKKGP